MAAKDGHAGTPSSTTSSTPTPTQTPAEGMLTRADRILTAFQGPQHAFRLSDLARAVNLPKATTSRIAAELVQLGYLERRDNMFELGIKLFELGSHTMRPSNLRKLALRHMADLRSATRHTVQLAVLDGTAVVYVVILRSKLSPELPSRIGGRLPAYATGVGKAQLAYIDEGDLHNHLPDTLTPIGPHTITDLSQLCEQFRQIRETNIAYDREESTPGVSCAASAIFNADGHVIAGLSISAPSDRGDFQSLGAAVATATAGITREVTEFRFRASGLSVFHD